MSNCSKVVKNLVFQDSTTLSDHHKMIVTVLKVYMKKNGPIIIPYRTYKSFCVNAFKDDLKKNLEIFQKEMKYDDFKDIFMSTLNYHAPNRKKTVRGNQAPFVSKSLSKAIMHRSKLKNRYNKTPNESNKNSYKKQRNFCVNLLRKEKKKFYENLDLKVLEDNRKFWQNIRPLFSEKNKTSTNNIIIVEDDKITNEKKEVAEKLNKFFIDSVANLDIEPFLREGFCSTDLESNQEIAEIVRKYKDHPSVLKIKEHVKFDQRFEFSNVTKEKIETDISLLDAKKAHMDNDIPTNLLVETRHIVILCLKFIITQKMKMFLTNPLKWELLSLLTKQQPKLQIKKIIDQLVYCQ